MPGDETGDRLPRRQHAGRATGHARLGTGPCHALPPACRRAARHRRRPASACARATPISAWSAWRRSPRARPRRPAARWSGPSSWCSRRASASPRQLLEAAEADIDYATGFFSVAGTDRRLGLFEVARRAGEAGRDARHQGPGRGAADLPQRLPHRRGRDRSRHRRRRRCSPTSRSTTAASSSIRCWSRARSRAASRRASARRCARTRCTTASGQLLAGSFMDYAMPRADMLPNFTSIAHPVPCTTNPLGVKGTGEAGTTGALAAVMNAISDALPGTRHRHAGDAGEDLAGLPPASVTAVNRPSSTLCGRFFRFCQTSRKRPRPHSEAAVVRFATLENEYASADNTHAARRGTYYGQWTVRFLKRNVPSKGVPLPIMRLCRKPLSTDFQPSPPHPV